MTKHLINLPRLSLKQIILELMKEVVKQMRVHLQELNVSIFKISKELLQYMKWLQKIPMHQKGKTSYKQQLLHLGIENQNLNNHRKQKWKLQLN